MSNRISAEEVAQQFAKSIQMLLWWIEQRDKGKKKTFRGQRSKNMVNKNC